VEIKPPKPIMSTSVEYNRLQREAADRVTQRFEDQRRKDRRRALAATIRNFVAVVILLLLAGAGFYAWRSGMLGDWIGEGKAAPANMDAVERPASAPPGANASEVSPSDVAGPKENKDDKDVRARNVDAYSEVVRQFRRAKVDYWKNVIDADRPGKSGSPLKFWCLTGNKDRGPVILELSMSKGEKMKVRRLSASNGLVDSSETEFARLTAKEPYLVMREERAYFAFKGKGRLPAAVPAPQKDKALNPGQVEFGDLYAIFMDMKMNPPEFLYDVLFEVKGGGPILKIATVRFGEDVPYRLFFAKVAEHYDLSESEAMAIDAVLKLGKARVVFADFQPKR